MRGTQSNRKRQQRGVTLLELLAVLAAMAVLSSIAIPAFNGYIERARSARAVTDIGTLSLGLYRWQLNTRTFPATLAEAGLGGNDPWGRPYAYLRVAGANNGQLRKDHNLVPINTDFDLYSSGPDGESVGPLTAKKSRDDIVRANNGRYIGLAANY
jgi:general secretion pathway protein G